MGELDSSFRFQLCFLLQEKQESIDVSLTIKDKDRIIAKNEINGEISEFTPADFLDKVRLIPLIKENKFELVFLIIFGFLLIILAIVFFYIEYSEYRWGKKVRKILLKQCKA